MNLTSKRTVGCFGGFFFSDVLNTMFSRGKKKKGGGGEEKDWQVIVTFEGYSESNTSHFIMMLHKTTGGCRWNGSRD